MKPTEIKKVQTWLSDGSQIPAPWGAHAIVNEDNMTYLLWNDQTREAIIVDPMREDWATLVDETAKLSGFRFIAVIDTHTHADHVSNAAQLAQHLNAPLIQHEKSPSRRVHLRVSRDTALSTAAAPLILLDTPGHTPDCITPIWGPFILGADMIFYADTGRDDLPGGDPKAHWESLQKIKQHARPEMILLPGHDGRGGRASSWKTQLEINDALKQDLTTYLKEGGAWIGPSPKLLKESLYENFK
jgi:sulfur dioxygenase